MIPIVFSTDHNFVMPTGVSIYSLLYSAGTTSYDIYILINESVTPEDKELLTRQVEFFNGKSTIQFLSVGDTFKNSYETRGVTIATYYRLLIPWLLPHLDKVIYSDGDIIFKGSLENLYNEDLGNNYISGNKKEHWNSKASKRIRSLGIDPIQYTNAGFLVINSRIQRLDNLLELYMSHTEKQYYYQDQDIINIVCQGRNKFFDPAYNCTPPAFKDLCCKNKLSYDDIIVIHYAGTKPWKGFCAFWMEWWQAYHNSIFFDEQFYYEVTRKCLNPREFIKNMYTKVINKYFK